MGRTVSLPPTRTRHRPIWLSPLANKLILGFGLICSILVAIGGIFFFSVRSIEKLDSAARSSVSGEIANLHRLGENLVLQQAAVFRQVAATSPAERERAEQIIGRLEKANGIGLNEYKETVANRAEGRLHAQLLQARKTYSDRIAELLPLSRTSQKGEIITFALARQIPAYDRYQAALNAAVLFEEAEQSAIAADTTGQIQRSRVVGNLLITLAILAVVGTAVAVIRMVRTLREDKRTLRTEVDEHERTEQALREGEARYRLLVDHSPDGILVICEDKIVFANPALLTLLGAERPDQLIGRSPSDIVHPAERYQIAHRASEVAAGGQPPVAERRMLRLDGSILAVESSIISFLYEGKTAEQVIVRDNTARRAAQKQQGEAEEKYRSIFENAAEGIFQNTPEGAFLSANPALARMLGFDSPEELIRERHDLEQLGYAEPAKRGEFQRLLEEKGFVNNFEYEALRRDGSTIWVSENVRIVRDDAGKALYYEGSVQDITERKRAEEEMRRSVQRFQSFTTATSQIVWQTDPNGRVVEDLPTWRDYTGQTLKQILGTGWTDCLHPDDRARTLSHWAECRKHKSHYDLEYRLLGADGTYRYFSVRGVPVLDSAGEIREWVGLNADITVRKLAEKQLFESRQMLRSVLDNIPQRVFWKDLNSVYLGCNLAFAQDAGIGDPESSVGKTDEDANWREHADLYRADDRAVMESGVSKLGHEEPLQDASGRSIWLKTNKVPLRDQEGKVYGVLGTYEDITEHRLSIEQIAEQAALLDQAHDAILISDLKGDILFWSKGAERLYGYAKSEALGRKAGELLYGEHTAKYHEANAATIVRGEWYGELEQVVKDGHKIIVDVRWTLVRDKEGNPKSILAINTDITEHKKIEEQFLRAQRLESIGTLASGVAHDLNNILSPIMLAAPILRDEMEPAERDKFLDIIESSAQRGGEIIKQILTFARGADGDRVLLQPIYFLEEISRIASQTFPKSINIRTRHEEDLRSVEGDAGQLHQVLLNLCINARDAMPNGGELLLEAENFDVDEHFAAMTPGATPGPHVLLQVTDNGSGIPPEVVARIFDPFFTTKEVGKGTGLGLSTVAGIVKSHGGFLQVSSEPGRTTFRVYLPAMKSVSLDHPLAVEVSVPHGKGETILLVDDEIVIREVAQLILQNNGYKVLVAEDGPSALALFAQQIGNVAVVVTDLAMPIMDGLALVRALRRIQPGLKVIISSGRTEDRQSAEIAALHVEATLNKPYTTRKLLLKLSQVLEGGLQEVAA